MWVLKRVPFSLSNLPIGISPKSSIRKFNAVLISSTVFSLMSPFSSRNYDIVYDKGREKQNEKSERVISKGAASWKRGSTRSWKRKGLLVQETTLGLAHAARGVEEEGQKPKTKVSSPVWQRSLLVIRDILMSPLVALEPCTWKVMLVK